MRAKREPAAGPAAQIIEPGSARYFAWLYARGRRRDLLLALAGIEHEAQASLRPGLEHEIAHLRVQWWREECVRFANGTPAHPTTRRLLELAGPGAAGIELQGIVDAVAWDLAAAPCDTRAELESGCARWAQAVIVPFVVGGPARENAPLAQAARGVGTVLREIELLLRLAPDARRGRLRIPLDELDAMHVEARTLSSAPWPAVLAEHLRRRFEALRAALGTALATMGDADRRESTGLAAWCAVASASAARAVRGLPHAPGEGRLDRLANGLYAWRAARAAMQGGMRLP